MYYILWCLEELIIHWGLSISDNLCSALQNYRKHAAVFSGHLWILDGSIGK